MSNFPQSWCRCSHKLIYPEGTTGVLEAPANSDHGPLHTVKFAESCSPTDCTVTPLLHRGHPGDQAGPGFKPPGLQVAENILLEQCRRTPFDNRPCHPYSGTREVETCGTGEWRMTRPLTLTQRTTSSHAHPRQPGSTASTLAQSPFSLLHTFRYSSILRLSTFRSQRDRSSRSRIAPGERSLSRTTAATQYH